MKNRAVRGITAIGLLMLSVNPSHADTYLYTCKAGGRTSMLKIDEAQEELTWKNAKYKLVELPASDQQVCPRFGWRATRASETFNFCTATQGMAYFTSKGVAVQCDQKL